MLIAPPTLNEIRFNDNLNAARGIFNGIGLSLAIGGITYSLITKNYLPMKITGIGMGLYLLKSL